MEIDAIIKKQKENRWTIAQTKASERIQKLKKLRSHILSQREKIYKALQDDFNKKEVEIELTEIQPVIAEINFHIKKLCKWMKIKRVKTPMMLMGTKSYIRYEPRGLVLIISPWNYPFNLTMVPLISAIAAGNCVVLKPSELTPHTSSIIHSIVSNSFPAKEVTVVEGGVETAQELLQYPFDHIFFTGSTHLGKEIMKKAAEHLSSITLELGGKTPAIVDETAKIKVAAERIVWGKFMNAGQTCVAPDYVFVQEQLHSLFIDEVKKVAARFFEGSSDDFPLCSIINEKHFMRLKKLYDDSLKNGGILELGGKFDIEQKHISPTILSNIDTSAPIMQQEIFGPILPILKYKNITEVISFIQNTGKPLALYIFSNNQKNINTLLHQTSAGGTCINNVAIYLGNPHLPFGGVNSSGVGSYHGFHGFRTFSHERPIMYQGIFSGLSFVYPPYTQNTKKLAQWVTNFFS